MKIYDVIPDVNRYKSLFPEDEAVSYQSAYEGGALYLDCLPKETWSPMPVFCLHPKKKTGDFFGFHVGTFVVPKDIAERAGGFFEMAGELLPVIYESQEYYMLNVTECVNSLNADKSGWLLTDTGQRALLQKYVFHKNRFTESSLFKIPETCRATLLTYERSGDPEEEFKAFVESEGLTGLLFKELWDSEG